jgi:hypothetical protein
MLRSRGASSARSRASHDRRRSSRVAVVERTPGVRSFLDQAGTPLVSVALRCTVYAPPIVELRPQRDRPAGGQDARRSSTSIAPLAITMIP